MRRVGFALAAALMAVVLVGALIVGAFIATNEESRIAGNVATATQALAAAEAATETDVAGWAAAEADSLGVAQRVSHSSGSAAVPVTVTLVRLDSALYWLVGDAAVGGGGPPQTFAVRRRIGLLLRRVPDSTGKATLSRLGERAWSELF